MTLEEFMKKHTSYTLRASDNDILLEVNCQARNKYVSDEEIADLKEIGYTNMLGEDQTTMTCGWAIFRKVDPTEPVEGDYIPEAEYPQ